jgi:hypothetical protein
MRIIDKYKKLQDDRFVVAMISESVYGTMVLEEQAVPMAKVKEIVLKTHKRRKQERLELA